MIRIIDNKPLDLSNEEYDYYLSMVKTYGQNCLKDTFDSDPKTGFITLVKPPLTYTIRLGIIFFLFNVSLNQRIRDLENLTQELRKEKENG